MTREPAPSLLSLFGRFLRFGLFAWGGPVAQIAMLKKELVEEQRWLSPERFNRLLAAYQVLPGPEAHELCVHIGMMKRGRLGGIAAGLGFMLPGLLLILAIAWAYERLDLQHPVAQTLFLGAQIGVVALIVRAVHRMADHTLGDVWLWAVAIIAAIAALLGVSFWLTLPVAGLAYALIAGQRLATAFLVAAAGVGLAVWATPDPELLAAPALIARDSTGAADSLALFLSGLKAGLLTFGGAYTAIPFVRDDAVQRGWVSEGQFLDGLALSGVIPAPLIIFATFVGYIAGGLAGALAITAGIFLPAFAFGLIFYDRLEHIIEDARLHRFLEGVAAAVVGLIAATAIPIALNVFRAAPVPVAALAIFGGALAILYLWRSKFAVPAVVFGAALAGLSSL